MTYMTKTFRQMLFVVSIGLFALPLHAQIYKSLDANGKTIFTDKPPMSDKTKVTTLSTAKPMDTEANQAKENWAEKDAAFRRRQLAANQKEQQMSDSAQRACESAQSKMRLIDFSDGKRLAKVDAQGFVTPVNDAQRASEKRQVQEEIARNCR